MLLTTIGRRMAARKGPFIPTALLDNQFATLQEPSPEERAIIVDDILRRLPPKLEREPA
jgi:gluconokinase